MRGVDTEQRARATAPSTVLISERQQKKELGPMKTILLAAVAIALATTAAQAEIICTHHGGCYETGLKLIYGDGGGVNPNNQTLNSYRTGKKVKVQIRRTFIVN